MIPDPWNPMRRNHVCAHCGELVEVVIVKGGVQWPRYHVDCARSLEVAERLTRRVP